METLAEIKDVSTKSRKVFIPILVLIWAVILIGIYYYFHKPINLLHVTGILKSLWAFTLGFLILELGAGLGRFLLKLGRFRFQDEVENLLIQVGIGLGALGILWLGLSWMGLLSIWVAILLLILLLVSVGRDGFVWMIDAYRQISSFRPTTRLELWLLIFIILLIFISLAHALAPPVAWDALLYHLTIPKLNISIGEMVIDPALPESGYPQLSEMLFTWSLLLRSERAPAVLHWWFGLLTLALVWSWGRKWNRITGYLACAILLTATTFSSLMGKAYIDLSTIFYTCIAFAAIEGWRDKSKWQSLFIAGILAGLAFSTKYNGVVIGFALAAIVIIRQPRRSIRNLLIFGAGALITSIPWLVKNYALSGNPTYPFLFGGLGWDHLRSEWFGQSGTGLFSTNPVAVVTAPFIMSLVGEEGADIWHATFGPLFLILVPLIFLRWKKHEHRTWIEDALLFSGIVYTFWLIGAGTSRLLIQPRFLFPILPLLAVVASVAVLSMSDYRFGQIRIVRVLGVIITLVFVLTLFSSLTNLQQEQALPTVFGLIEEEEFLYRRLGWYFAAIGKSNELPDYSYVLFLFEPRSYHCVPGRCRPDGILDNWFHAVKTKVSTERILDEWRGLGITHVLIYQLGLDHLRDAAKDPLSSKEWSQLDEFIDQHLSLEENFGNAYLLYEVLP